MKDFLHHLFIPRESNNHRSKLLHYEVLLLVIAVLISGLITMAGVQREYPAVLGDATRISVAELMMQTNLKRQENGLAPLTLNAKLSQAATQKARDMFAKDYWAHVSPDGTTPWVFIKDSGYEYLYAGENLARGFTTGTDVVNAWMASPTHRENLLSPNYTDIGFAVETGSLTGSETVLVVQEFGSPYNQQAADAGDVAMAVSTPAPIVVVPPGSVSEPSDNLSPTPFAIAQAQVNEPPTFEGVASIQNNPLIDDGIIKRNIGFFFLMLFIVVLLLDAIIVERRKIVRVFSHNVDHVLFFMFILLAGMLISRGVIV